MTAAASFKIGPLTTYADPADMRAWLESARPGEESKYACGPYLADHEAKRLAAEWAARGLVHLFAPRSKTSPHCFDYLMRKRAQAAAGGSARRDLPMGQPPEDAQWRFSLEGRLYELLCEAAAEAAPCPSNDRLAAILGLSTPQDASYRFNNLVRAGLIAVIEPARFSTRVIEICASGRRTRASHVERRKAAAR